MNEFEEAIRNFPKTSEGGYGFIKDHNCAVYQALRIAAAVEKHKLALKAYKEAGDKATQSKWEFCGTHWGEGGITTVNYNSPNTLNGVPYSRLAEKMTFDDADFSAKAANTRNAIKDILREIEG